MRVLLRSWIVLLLFGNRLGHGLIVVLRRLRGLWKRMVMVLLLTVIRVRRHCGRLG